MNWHDIFVYSNGILYWKIRPLSDFPRKSSGKTWNTRFSGKPAGWVHKNPKCKTHYIYVEAMGKRSKAHRIIWEMNYGEIPEGLCIDHIDGNGLNNSLANLRLVTDADNQKNLPSPSNNTSGTSGVSWFGRTEKWRAYIKFDGKQKHLGYYENYEDAVMARIIATKEYGYHKNHGRQSSVHS